MPSEVVLYTCNMCGDCQLLEAFMDANGITYATRNISEDADHRAALEEKTGKLGVPYLIIDGEWKRGYVPGQVFSEAFARELFGLD